MINTTDRPERIRVQLDMTPADVGLMDLLERRLAVRSRADLLQQAFGTFLWILDQLLAGRRVVSVDPEVLEQVPRYRELHVPAVAALGFDQFDHLAPRAGSGRRQPYLKGRNMTVGQLVYRMRANNLSTEDAAADLDLPPAQIREAVAYYHVHRDEVDGEMAEEARRLREEGAAREPEDLPR